MSRNDKIFYGFLMLIPIVLFTYGVYMIFIGGPKLVKQEEIQKQELKKECINRGGTVIEYHGGWTDWACEGLKK